VSTTTPPPPSGPARFQSGTFQNKAYLLALRQKFMKELYGALPGTFGKLTKAQQDEIKKRQQARFQNHQRGGLGLDEVDPFLRERFLANRKASAPATPPVTNNPGTPTPTTPPAPTNPYIQINSNGQLDLPYNQQFAGYLLDAKDQMNQRLMQLAQSKQEQDLDFTRTTRDAEVDYQNAARAALNQASGRGTAFSSAYAKDVSDNATNYQNYMQDLTNSDLQFEQGVTAERGGIETTFNDMLRRYALDQANADAENAGDLGYGKPNPAKPIPKPKPYVAPKRPSKPAGAGMKWVATKGPKGRVTGWRPIRRLPLVRSGCRCVARRATSTSGS
jgi:hypothetical protein